jgi:hypothetical protein
MLYLVIAAPAFRRWLNALSIWLARALYLQLALTALSLPLIIAWGLPLSLLSIAGNIIFTPFLLAFLALSSLVFFCELIYIPNTLCVRLLEYLTLAWKASVSFHNNPHNILLELPCPSVVYLVALVLMALALLHTRKLSTLYQRSSALICFIVISCGFLYFFGKPSYARITYQFNAACLTFIRLGSKIICIDTGVSKKAAFLKSWSTYTLFPELRRKLGSSSIDILIMLKPTSSSFDLAHIVLSMTNHSAIVMPLCHSPLSRSIDQSLNQLSSWAREYRHVLVFIKDKPVCLYNTCDSNLHVNINGMLKRTKYTEYPAISILLEHKQEKINFTPALTRREQVLPQIPQAQAVNTKAYTLPAAHAQVEALR